MRPLLPLLALALAAATAPGRAATNPAAFVPEADGYDKAAIRGAEMPADAPTFARFPAGPVLRGPFAAPRVNDSRRTHEYRTTIRESASEGVNFAGHYRLVSWGCGTGCAEWAVVDGITGRVFSPPDLRDTDFDDIAFDEFGPEPVELVRFRADSQLLVVIGRTGGDNTRRGISWFVWEHDRLRRIRFVPHPG